MHPALPLTPESILSIMNDFPSFSFNDAVVLTDLPSDTVQETLDLLVSCELLSVSFCSEYDISFYERVE